MTFLGGRGDPPAPREPLPIRVSVLHVEGADARELFAEAGDDVGALEVIATMEAVRPGGPRPDVLALLAERLGDG